MEAPLPHVSVEDNDSESLMLSSTTDSLALNYEHFGESGMVSSDTLEAIVSPHEEESTLSLNVASGEVFDTLYEFDTITPDAFEAPNDLDDCDTIDLDECETVQLRPEDYAAAIAGVGD